MLYDILTAASWLLFFSLVLAGVEWLGQRVDRKRRMKRASR